MSTATQNEMNELHGELAKLMKAKLKEMKDAGIDELNTGFLSAVRQFLKDNHIETSLEAPSEPLAELTKEFPFPTVVGK